MKKVINPGRARKSINFIDNIVYSRQKDLEGNEMELRLRSQQFSGFQAVATVAAIRI